MKNIKTDHRSKYTQMIVKQSLLKLVGEKPLNKITVAQLCEEAGINRGTFYNHFCDVFDVLDSIEQEFYDEIKAKFQNEKLYLVSNEFFKNIMELVKENLKLINIILIDKDNSAFLKKALSFVRQRYISEVTEQFPNISVKTVENVFSYSINGSIGIITEWIRNGTKQSTEEIAGIVEKFNSVIIENLLK